MLGRVRQASSASIDSLERPPSKLLKDDSLSIYEATLMKLKLGSKRVPSTHSEEAVEMETDNDSLSVSESFNNDLGSDCSCVSNASHHAIILPHKEATMIDSDCSSASISPSTGDVHHSIGASKHQHNRNVSVLYMFSKFETSRNVLKPSYKEAMTSESSCSSINVSPISSKCQTLGSTKDELEQECVSSIPAFPI